MQTYKELYFKLQQDTKALKLKRHKLDLEQVSMLDFIEGKKKIAQFNINGKIITLSNTGYEKNINDVRLRAIVNKDGLIERVLSHFSDRGTRMEMGDLS